MYRLSLLALLSACGVRSVTFHDDTGDDLACGPGEDPATWYRDVDGDGYGDDGGTTTSCGAPPDSAAVGGDCDDADATTFPGALEVCNAVDDDCDGAVDDADPSVGGLSTFHVDADSDGHGSAAAGVDACDAPPGFVASADDCDDADAAVHPGAIEIIGDGRDADCDGGEACYADGDADGYASTSGAAVVSADVDCVDAGEAGAAVSATDCDDTDAAVSPAGTEACNTVDDDCDGAVDEGLGSTWYADADGDGSGDATVSTEACVAPAGYAASSDDCDDTEPLAAPGLAEVCGDGIDNDCAGDLGECTLDASYAAEDADYRLTGTDSGDYMGGAVALGDFDGDGTGDLVGGMYGYDVPSSTAGAATIWYGPIVASGTAATADALLTGSVSDSSTYVGYDMSAGDHDGDGADDLVVGAHGVDFGVGVAYLVYGGSRRTTGEIAAAAGVATFEGGAVGDSFGYSVGAGGDLDGDGTEELVIGGGGAAHVYYGSATARSGTSAGSAADAVVEQITSVDGFGTAVAVVSDMDGDGLSELLFGAYRGGATTGEAYVFLGGAPLSGTISASAADATYTGGTARDELGRGVYDLTDVTGDGYADAGVHSRQYRGVGALSVFAGGATLSTAAAATLDGDNAAYFGDEAGSPGDLDGDGVNDLLVGYSRDWSTEPAEGTTSLWYGPVSGSLPSSSADVVFSGATTGGAFGESLPDRAGDVTGNGTPDVVIGDSDDDVASSREGAIYIWDGLGGE